MAFRHKLQTLKPRLQTLKPRLASYSQGPANQRIKGNTWRAIRDKVMAADPLCANCKAKGFVTLAADVDHRVPLWAGGSETDKANLQGLCKACHKDKTACEAAMRAAGGWMAAECTCGQH